MEAPVFGLAKLVREDSAAAPEGGAALGGGADSGLGVGEPRFDHAAAFDHAFAAFDHAFAAFDHAFAAFDHAFAALDDFFAASDHAFARFQDRLAFFEQVFCGFEDAFVRFEDAFARFQDAVRGLKGCADCGRSWRLREILPSFGRRRAWREWQREAADRCDRAHEGAAASLLSPPTPSQARARLDRRARRHAVSRSQARAGAHAQATRQAWGEWRRSYPCLRAGRSAGRSRSRTRRRAHRRRASASRRAAPQAQSSP